MASVIDLFEDPFQLSHHANLLRMRIQHKYAYHHIDCPVHLEVHHIRSNNDVFCCKS